MGIIKDVVATAAKEAAKSIGRDAAYSVLGAADTATKKASKAVKKAVKAANDTAKKVIEANNSSRLKKEARKEDYCLFVQKEADLEKDIYKVTDNRKNDKYSTIKEKAAIINIYSEENGKIALARINKNSSSKLFSKPKTEIDYVIEDRTGINRLILTIVDQKMEARSSFRNWMFAGDLLNCNYKILNVDNGKELAAVTKKNRTASAFLISCEEDYNEQMIVIVAILIDLAKTI